MNYEQDLISATTQIIQKNINSNDPYNNINNPFFNNLNLKINTDCNVYKDNINNINDNENKSGILDLINFIEFLREFKIEIKDLFLVQEMFNFLINSRRSSINLDNLNTNNSNFASRDSDKSFNRNDKNNHDKYNNERVNHISKNITKKRKEKRMQFRLKIRKEKN